MSAVPRPPMPEGFDASRAAQRAADPRGWRYAEDALAAVHRVIAERRDIRRFRAEDVPDDVLDRILAAAHRAPSVGLMQPWRLIVVRDLEARAELRRVAQRERLRQAERFDDRARQFLDQKIEGIVEAPLGICVCCHHGAPGEAVLGRGTIPDTDVYSAACAIQNLWLAARAEGLGVGWVSFYRFEDLRAILGIPADVDPIAWLCVGWPDERPVRPGLEAQGWASRLPLEDVVLHERWDGRAAPRAVRPVAREAAIAVRDRADELVKPAGSLGALEAVAERWASITAAPPPARLRAGVLVCAGDHGHGVSLFGAGVSSQVAQAAARGGSAVGVLAREGGHELVVADVGLHGPTHAGVVDCKVAAGTADLRTGPAMTAQQRDDAMDAGRRLVRGLQDVDCVVVGEIGIGNTATAAALACALTGVGVQHAVGRGTGPDAAGLEHKRALVQAALDRVGPPAPAAPGGERAGAAARVLCELGGLELAALTGVVLEAWEAGLPVVLDGFATAVAALAAVRLQPVAGAGLLASHRSAEPGHELVLTELGLEPLLDLRLRLGEASGALLALGLIGHAGLLHERMATFAQAGVDRAP